MKRKVLTLIAFIGAIAFIVGPALAADDAPAGNSRYDPVTGAYGFKLGARLDSGLNLVTNEFSVGFITNLPASQRPMDLLSVVAGTNSGIYLIEARSVPMARAKRFALQRGVMHAMAAKYGPRADLPAEPAEDLPEDTLRGVYGQGDRTVTVSGSGATFTVTYVDEAVKAALVSRWQKAAETALALSGAEPISFPTAYSMVSNVQPVSCDGKVLTYRSPKGFETVELSALPADLKKLFGYGLSLRQASGTAEQPAQPPAHLIAARDAEPLDAMVARDKFRKQRGVVIWGRVLQRTSRGLLIDADSESGGDTSPASKTRLGSYILSHAQDFNLGPEWKTEIPADWLLASGILLLTDCPNRDKVVEGQTIALVAWPIGGDEYTNAQGDKRFVPRYTASLDRAYGSAPPAKH